MKKSRLVALLITLVMVAGLIAACAPAAPAPAPAADPVAPAPAPAPAPAAPAPAPAQPAPVAPPAEHVHVQDTITILAPSLAVSLSPWASNDMPSAEMHELLYDRLFVQDYDTFLPVIERQLAINWSQPDARTTYVEIRSGVYFHNGDPLTAEDVRFSLEMAGTSAHTAPFLNMIDSVEIIDDHNVIIRTDIDFAPIIAHLAHTGAAIVNSRVFQELGEDDFALAPVGSGPWMFDTLVLGDRIELVRNPNYWGTPAHLERLIYRAVPEASVRLMEVQAGTADVAMAIAPIDVAVAEADPNVNMRRRMNLAIDYLGFNATAPHLNNHLVRQAINYAVDTATINDVVWMGLREQLHGPFPPNVWGFAEQAPFDFNLARAAELLREAGYNPTPGEPGGFSTTIWWNIPNAQREQTAEMVAFTLAMLNIEVEVIGMEWAAYLEGTENAEHDMFILGWVSVTGDPDYSLFPTLHSSNFGPGNRTFWGTPELDALLEAGRSEVDPVARAAIYAEAQYLIRNEAPWVFLNWAQTLIATSANLEGFVINPNGRHNWSTAWFS